MYVLAFFFHASTCRSLSVSFLLYPPPLHTHTHTHATANVSNVVVGTSRSGWFWHPSLA